jgi:hypothetical protein
MNLCVVFLMGTTALLGDDNKCAGGYLSRTLQLTFWEQEGMMLSFMMLYNGCNQYWNVLSHQARRNQSGKIHHHSLKSTLQSYFMHFYNAVKDDALITVMGFSFSTFWDLVELFKPVYLHCTPHASCFIWVKHHSAAFLSAR